jgi:hypothetical protein
MTLSLYFIDHFLYGTFNIEVPIKKFYLNKHSNIPPCLNGFEVTLQAHTPNLQDSREVFRKEDNNRHSLGKGPQR